MTKWDNVVSAVEGAVSNAQARRIVTMSNINIPVLCDIPVYIQGPITGKDHLLSFVRISDIKDENERERLNLFMQGKYRLLVDEEMIPMDEQDFIYLFHYEEFCSRKLQS